MATQSNHKRISRSVVIFAIACTVAFAFLLFVEGPKIITKHVTGLKLEQSGFNVNMTWDEMECDGYDVTIICDAQRFQLHLEENHYTLRDVILEKNYRVIVSARLKDGHSSRDAKAEITTQKLRQKVKVSIDGFDGFRGDKIRIKAKGDGDITFSSGDDSVVTVDENGNIKLKKSGHTTVTATASGDAFHQAGSRDVPINVYPEELDRPSKPSVKNLSGSRALLSWKNIDFAGSYQLMKKNPHTKKYSVIDEVSADKPQITITRDDGNYAIRAKATVRDKTVKGKRSDAVTIKGTTQMAKSYSSARNVKVLNKSNLEVFREIHGDGATNVPQSICLKDDCYVVAYVNQSGSAGKLISYDKTDGECVSIEPCSGMGYANGLTYNPNTDKFYVAKTHKSIRTSSCSTYDGDTKESKGSFNLPRVTSGIAYDASSDKYYLSKGNEIYECDSDFKVNKFIHKFIRYNHAQDIGVYNGVVLVCTWVSGNKSYIDLYRASDSAYLGSYDISIGEIESCFVDDGYLVVLMNTVGNHNDLIYRTKERIAF